MVGATGIRFLEAVALDPAQVDRARDALQALPRRSSAEPSAPVSFTDALNIVALRDEERKRKENRRDSKSKAKGGAPTSPASQFPGSVPGQEREQSAYWMFMEVREACQTAQCFRYPANYSPVGLLGVLSSFRVNEQVAGGVVITLLCRSAAPTVPLQRASRQAPPLFLPRRTTSVTSHVTTLSSCCLHLPARLKILPWWCRP